MGLKVRPAPRRPVTSGPSITSGPIRSHSRLLRLKLLLGAGDPPLWEPSRVSLASHTGSVGLNPEKTLVMCQQARAPRNGVQPLRLGCPLCKNGDLSRGVQRTLCVKQPMWRLVRRPEPAPASAPWTLKVVLGLSTVTVRGRSGQGRAGPRCPQVLQPWVLPGC